MKQIRIRGARTHNLADLNLDLPRDRLTVVTGLSGSGKSSLAFDTLFAEGQRRYVESLSAYARQFLARMEKPDVDSIEGLSPSIAIEQKSASHNPRSTVGTHHRDPRLPAAAVRARRRAALPAPRPGPAGADRHRDDRPRAGAAGGAAHPADRAGAARAQGRAPGAAAVAARPGLPARAHRRRGARTRRAAAAGPAPQAHHRGGGRPADGAPGTARPAGRILRDRAAPRPGRGLRGADGRAGCGPDHVLQPVRLPALRLQPGRAGAAAVLLQQPRRRLPGMRRPGHADLLRPRQGGPRGPLAARRRDPRLGRAQRRLFPHDPRPGAPFRLLPGRGVRPAVQTRPRHRPERLAGAGQFRVRRCRRTPQPRPASVRGRAADHAAPLPRHRVDGGARGTGALPLAARLPGMRRRTPGRGGPPRVPRRRLPAAAAAAADPRGAGAFPPAEAARPPGPGRRQGGRRNRAAAELPGRRGPRLPEPGAPRRDPVRRRGAAHPPGQPDRRRTGRRHLHSGRAFDRPAPARQRAPAGHARAPARPGQHGGDGGARRERHPPRRPRGRPGPRRRRPRRPGWWPQARRRTSSARPNP